MAFVPIAIMVASAAVAAYGAVQQGKAQEASYKSQQAAENYNATVERQNANAEMGAASANEIQQRMQNDQRMGMERGRIAESGGGFTGTNVGVLAQNGANLELSALNTRYRGDMAARGDLAAANENDLQAEAAGNNATTARQGSYWSAASSALGSASNYANYRSVGSQGSW